MPGSVADRIRVWIQEDPEASFPVSLGVTMSSRFIISKRKSGKQLEGTF